MEEVRGGIDCLSDNNFGVRLDPGVEEEVGSDAPRAFFLEFLLPQGFPDVSPKFDPGDVNNSKYPEAIKAAVWEVLRAQAEEQKGESMYYNLVECLKEKLPQFYRLILIVVAQESDNSDSEHQQHLGGGKKDASGKDKLTKV